MVMGLSEWRLRAHGGHPTAHLPCPESSAKRAGQRLPPGPATGRAFFAENVHWTFSDRSSPPRAGAFARSRLELRWEGWNHKALSSAVAVPPRRAGAALCRERPLRPAKPPVRLTTSSAPRISSCAADPRGGPAPSPDGPGRRGFHRPDWRPRARSSRHGGESVSASPPDLRPAPRRYRRFPP
jgi:hypothetical protein